MLKIFTTFMTCTVVLFSGVASLGTAGELKTHHLGDTIPNFRIRTLQGRKTTLQAIQADEKNNSSGGTWHSPRLAVHPFFHNMSYVHINILYSGF